MRMGDRSLQEEPVSGSLLYGGFHQGNTWSLLDTRKRNKFAKLNSHRGAEQKKKGGSPGKKRELGGGGEVQAEKKKKGRYIVLKIKKRSATRERHTNHLRSGLPSNTGRASQQNFR